MRKIEELSEAEVALRKRMGNTGTILTAVIIMVLTVIGAEMATHFIHDTSVLRVIWAACALIGYRMLRRARPEFYSNRSGFFWLCLAFMYFILGPGVLGLGVIVTICPPLKY